jgi:hypothetical protein
MTLSALEHESVNSLRPDGGAMSFGIMAIIIFIVGLLSAEACPLAGLKPLLNAKRSSKVRRALLL